LGELTYGALNSHSVDANLANLEKLRTRCRFVPVDEAIVREYGRIRLALKKKGRPIPENDVWIAATASRLMRRY
jgi:tRNA(fMet)-specific endonuclease VapC